MVKSKTLLEDWQVPNSAQQVPIAKKEEEGGVAFVKQGNTDAVKKYPKGKYHGCGMVNDNFLPECKFVSEEAKKMILADKRQEWQAKNQGLVAAEVKEKELESDKTPVPTHKELKDMLGFINLSVHH